MTTLPLSESAMRTALGAVLLTMGLYATLGAAFMGVAWSNPMLAAACGVAALVLLAASVPLLWAGPSRRWLVVLPALGLGFAFLILSMVFTKCGTTAKGQNAQGKPLQELYVHAFGRELHLEVGPEGPMVQK